MKRVDRYWFPDSEEHLFKGRGRVDDIKAFILPAVEGRRRVVQAGGAAGVWPLEFSRFFENVDSFEPNPALRECFVRNIGNRTNIHLHEHGLWKEGCTGTLVEYDARNMGAWYFKPDKSGDIWVNTIDYFGFDDVDLIQLDIEGAEYEALLGAVETLEECRPVLCLELKTTQHFYGREVEDVYQLLRKLGYEQGRCFGRDQLWMPKR